MQVFSIKYGMLRSVHTKQNTSVSIKYGSVTVGERREYLHLWKQVFLSSTKYYSWKGEGIPSSVETSVSIKYRILQLERGGNTLTCGNKCFYQVWNVRVGEGREYLHLWKQVFLSSTEILQLERGGNTLTCGNKCFYQVWNVTVGEGREYLHLWNELFVNKAAAPGILHS